MRVVVLGDPGHGGPMADHGGVLIASVGGWLAVARGWDEQHECVVARQYWSGHCRPDLDHGGTQGEMLTLVREAYGWCWVDITVHEDGSADIAIFNALDGTEAANISGSSLGLALAAALLSAPSQKAGEP